ncbi:hypothetical protein LTR85_009053 [Meristemomyces frigidus]|nr:hypothetical protein LTR85_009053 [Meristemomyces frigidus]
MEGLVYEIRYVENTLAAFEGHRTPSDTKIVDEMLDIAEAKEKDIGLSVVLLTLTRSQASTGPSRPTGITRLWNAVCWSIRHGSSIGFALDWSRDNYEILIDPVPQASNTASWRLWFEFELYSAHTAGSFDTEIHAARPSAPYTPVQCPQPSEIRGYHGRSPEEDARSRRSATPPPPPPKTRPAQSQSASLDYASLMTEYNARWDGLQPHEANVLLPSVDFSLPMLQNRQHIAHTGSLLKAWETDMVMKANAFTFFARGFGLGVAVSEVHGGVTLRLKRGQADELKMQALQKHLRRKECVRWHPNKINARTGSVGVLDENIGRQDVVVAVRSAVQELTEECARLLA